MSDPTVPPTPPPTAPVPVPVGDGGVVKVRDPVVVVVLTIMTLGHLPPVLDLPGVPGAQGDAA